MLQSFLLGQVQLKHKLQSAGMEQFRQRIIAGYHLQPLERDETEQYITYRLIQAGWKDDPLIGKDAYDRVHTATAGVPRRINRLCERLMLYGALEQLHELSAKDVDTVAAEISAELGVTKEDEIQVAASVASAHFAEPKTKASAAVPPAVVMELMNRVSQLEAEVKDLRRTIARNKNLLRAALFDDDGSMLSD